MRHGGCCSQWLARIGFDEENNDDDDDERLI